MTVKLENSPSTWVCHLNRGAWGMVTGRQHQVPAAQRACRCPGSSRALINSQAGLEDERSLVETSLVLDLTDAGPVQLEIVVVAVPDCGVVPVGNCRAAIRIGRIRNTSLALRPRHRVIGLVDGYGGGRVPIDAVSGMLLAGAGDGQDVKAGDTVKVPEIGCFNAPSGSYGSRRDEPVMRPDVLSGRGEPGPDAGVRTSGDKAEGQRGKRVQDRLDEGLTAGPAPGGSPVHAVQQLGGRDGSDPDLLVGPQLLL